MQQHQQQIRYRTTYPVTILREKYSISHWRSLIEEIGRMRGHPYATVMNSVNITVYIVQNLQSQGAMGPLALVKLRHWYQFSCEIP